MKFMNEKINKILFDIDKKIRQKRSKTDYQIYVVVLLLLKYFHEIFIQKRIIPCYPENPEYYYQPGGNFDAVAFYIACPLGRWPYLRLLHETDDISGILGEVIEELKNHFPQLRDDSITPNVYDKIDERCLCQIISLINKITFTRKGYARRDLFSDTLTLLLGITG